MHGSIAFGDDYSAGALRKLARRKNNGRVALRLTATAAVLEGLRDAPCGRPKKRLTPEQEASVKAHVLQGPEPEKDGLVPNHSKRKFRIRH